MLKVIHSHPVWLPQTQTWMHTQLCRLPRDRIEVHAICERTENLDQFLVPNLHSLPKGNISRFFWNLMSGRRKRRRYSKFLESVGRRNDIRLIHSHFGPVGWLDVHAVQRLAVPHVVTFYGHDVGRLPLLNQIWRKRYAVMFSKVDAVLCEGSFMNRSLIALGCPPEKLRIHHLGIPTESIAFKPRIWRPKMPLRVLIAARFVEKKGLSFAIESLALVKNHAPLEITIIGNAPDTSRSRQEKLRILSAIERGGLASKVRLLGYQPHGQVFEEAYRHHVFLSPSVTASDGDSEGGAPVSIIEMAATGMPVVSTRHCDIPEVVGAAGAKLLAGERDVADLASKLRWLIDNASAWSPLLAGVRKHIESEYNADTQGARLAAIYEELIAANTGFRRGSFCS